jgi:hypothetical protein
LTILTLYAPVAQLDRAPAFEAVGRPFESGRARHITDEQRWPLLPLFILALTKHKPKTKQTKQKEDRSSILFFLSPCLHFSLSSLLRRAGAGDDLIGGGGDISGRLFRVEGGDEQDAAVGADDHGLAKEI